jgi:hypothetical protein
MMGKGKVFFLYFFISAACAGIWSLAAITIIPAGCTFPVVLVACLLALCWNYDHGHHDA